jgi:hypothetical protein
MRGCLFVLVIGAVVLVGGAWAGGPGIAGALVQGALEASGFHGRNTSVRVEADPPIEVVTGRADRVVVRSQDVTFDDLEADVLDLTLVDVSLTTRRFGSVEGTLEGVTVHQESGPVPVDHIDLAGPAANATATVVMDGEDVERLAADALNERLGLPIGGAVLTAPDVLSLTVAGQVVNARFVVEPDGSLSLAAPVPGNPRVVIVEGDPFRIDTAQVVDGEFVLVGTLDLVALLAG